MHIIRLQAERLGNPLRGRNYSEKFRPALIQHPEISVSRTFGCNRNCFARKFDGPVAAGSLMRRAMQNGRSADDGVAREREFVEEVEHACADQAHVPG